jgi:putative hydrolase of the HAD superfamily
MKVLLIDADGVLLKSGELFSNRFATEYGIAPELVSEFFRGPFSDCQSGKKDMREELPSYLEKWGWQSGVDEFLSYWFEVDTIFDESVVDAVRKIKETGVKCYLASNNEKYRAEDLWNQIEKKELLDGHYYSWELKTKKDDPLFFQQIIDSLGVLPDEVCFIDDDLKNVEAAASIGITAYLYKEEVFNEILATI